MRAYWLSSRSWILDEDSYAMRPNHARLLRGISSGMSSALVARAQPFQTRRRMLEMFTEVGYSIIDGEAKLVTSDGILRVSEIKRRLREGVDTHLELYMGEVHLRDLECSDMRRPPHGEYLPPVGLVSYAMKRFLTAEDLPVRVPRPLFSELFWIIQYLSRKWNRRISLAVENHTFPCEVSLDSAPADTSVRASAKVVATTDFQDESVVRLEIRACSFYLCCDGLLLA